MAPLSKLMVVYKKGDYVDVVTDGSQHSGMPHKFYHGKTGRVFDINQRSVGVVINKRVGGRIIPKRIHIRVEHVRHSQCREAFRDRVRKNDALKRDAKAKGVKVNTKRVPAQPRGEAVIVVAKTSCEFMNPIKFRELY